MKKKIIVMGNDAVGKTAMVRKFMTDKVPSDYKATLGVEISVKVIDIEAPNGNPLELDVWDFAGQDRFGDIRSIYYNGADAALILFDLTRINTFRDTHAWLNEMKKYCDDSIPFILVGNKLDLENFRRVKTEQIQEFLQRNKIEHYMEMSALKGWQIKETFDELVHMMI